MDAVLPQVEGLESILGSLRHIEKRCELGTYAPSSRLHLALVACEEALARLKEMADKCNTTQQPEGLKARFRHVRKRLAWPYKEETLAGLQTTLRIFQDNLSVALQNAGLEDFINGVEGLRPVLDVLQCQSTVIASNLDKQACRLEMLHNHMAGVTHVQQHHNSAMLRELSDLRTQVSKYDAAMRCNMVGVVGWIRSWSYDQQH